MLILATNISSIPCVNLGLTYLNLTGNPITDIVNIPAKPHGSYTGSMVTGSQPASSFTSVNITVGINPYTILFGQSLPTGLGVQLCWSQNGDASIVIVIDEGMGSL